VIVRSLNLPEGSEGPDRAMIVECSYLAFILSLLLYSTTGPERLNQNSDMLHSLRYITPV
jgi:hypothetical protein